jgi:hypothetical protein
VRLTGVEGGITPAGGADRPVDPSVGLLDIDQRDLLQPLRSGLYGHHRGMLEAVPLLVSVIELDRNLRGVTLEGAQWISA